MKKLLSVYIPQNILDSAILVGRIGIGAMMLTHGIPKMAMLSDPSGFMDFMGLGPEMSLGLVIFAEVFCSVFIMFGFATRLAAIPLAITMLVAIFVAHGDDPFNKQEMAYHYLLVYVMLALLGSGRYSIDYLLTKRNSQVA